MMIFTRSKRAHVVVFYLLLVSIVLYQIVSFDRSISEGMGLNFHIDFISVSLRGKHSEDDGTSGSLFSSSTSTRRQNIYDVTLYGNPTDEAKYKTKVLYKRIKVNVNETIKGKNKAIVGYELKPTDFSLLDDIEAHQEYMKRKNNSDSFWEVFDIKDENIQDYLLDDEIMSFPGKNIQGNFNAQTSKMINEYSKNICTSSKDYCCLSSGTFGKTISFNKKVREKYPFDGHRNFSMWTWYKAPNNRKLKNLADTLMLIVEQFESKRIKERDMAHLAMIGDSLSRQTYFAFICSLQRTLGANVDKRYYTYLTKAERFRIRIKPGTTLSVPNFIDTVEVSLNRSLALSLADILQSSSSSLFDRAKWMFKDKSKSENKNEIVKIKISFVEQAKTSFDDVTNEHTHATLKTLCGIPYTITSSDGKGKVFVDSNNPKYGVDTVMVNFGLHYFFKEDIAAGYPTADIVDECRKRGTQVIFRETYAQHFRYQYGGEFIFISHDIQPSFELQGRTNHLDLKHFCAPILLKKDTVPNWRTEVAIERFSPIKLEDNSLCAINETIKMSKLLYPKFDMIQAYAVTALNWKSFFEYDCTHALYSPGFYVPIIDGFFKAVLRYSLPKGSCINLETIPQSRFLQGPEGLRVGLLENHNTNYLPNINAVQLNDSIPFNQTILTPVLNITYT